MLDDPLDELGLEPCDGNDSDRPIDPEATDDRLVFFLPVHVLSGAGSRGAPEGDLDRQGASAIKSDIVGGDFTLLFSNQELAYLPADQWYCAQPGEVTVALPGANGQPVDSRLDAQELETESLRIGRDWGIVEASVDQAYLKLRSLYEQQKVKIPLLGAETHVPFALLVMAVISVGLAGWLSYCFRMIVFSDRRGKDEPWILTDPIKEWGRGHAWRRIPATTEAVLFHLIYACAMCAPATLVVLVYLERAARWWLGAILAVLVAVFTASVVTDYIQIVRQTFAVRNAK
jgi:hypothetical protein